MKLRFADERHIRGVARLLGPSSAAAKAIEDYEMRRAAGEDVTFYEERGVWVVGPNVRHLLGEV